MVNFPTICGITDINIANNLDIIKTNKCLVTTYLMNIAKINKH